VAAEGAVGPLHCQFRSPVAGASGTPAAESGSRAWINAINARQPIVKLYSVRAAAAPLRFEIRSSTDAKFFAQAYQRY
jgi:hypothetical protein